MPLQKMVSDTSHVDAASEEEKEMNFLPLLYLLPFTPPCLALLRYQMHFRHLVYPHFPLRMYIGE